MTRSRKSIISSGELPRRLDESLIRALHALLTEMAVSRTALRLGIQQPAMSRHLKTLRELTGDQLLVRVGNTMVLTQRGESLIAPTRRILNDLSLLTRSGGEFDPRTANHNFRIASYDFLPGAFYADVVSRVLWPQRRSTPCASSCSRWPRWSPATRGTSGCTWPRTGRVRRSSPTR